MRMGIEASWRHRLWTLGSIARTPASPLLSSWTTLRCAAPLRHRLSSGLAGVLEAKEHPAEKTSKKPPAAEKMSPMKQNIKPPPNLSPRLPKTPPRMPKTRELIRPWLPYPTVKATAVVRNEVEKNIANQLSHEKRLEEKDAPIPTFTEILRLLQSRTPMRTHEWRRHVLKLVIPNVNTKPLTTDIDDNIWDIHERTGCEIEFYKGIEGDDQSAVLLSGDDVAVQEAASAIMRVCEDVRVVRPDPSRPESSLVPGDPEVAQELCISTKPNQQPRHLRKLRKNAYIWQHRLEKLPKPKKWDKITFMQYVRTLTLVQLPPHRAIEFYGSVQASNEVVMALLHSVFNDKPSCEAVSLSAFKLALQHMEDRSLSFRPQARRLFTLMQIRNLSFDTDVFNKFLYGAAKVRDLKNFQEMLDFMAGYGCVPNYKTWRIFLQLVQEEGAKREALRAMERLGLLNNPHALSDSARELVSFDMHRALSAGETDPVKFCDQMDASYGAGWASATALHRMLLVSGHFGKHDMSFALLDLFAERYNIPPEQKHFVAIIGAAEATNSFRVALQALKRLESRPRKIHLTYHMYRDLASMANRCHLPNVAAAVWAYACLEEKTCFSMRLRVSQHLQYPGAALKPGMRIARSEGPGGRQLLPFFAMPGYFPNEVRKLLSAEVESHPEQAPHRGAVVAKLVRTMWQGYKPKEGLAPLLEKLLSLDHAILEGRRALAGTPGSHVVSIAEKDLPQWLRDTPPGTGRRWVFRIPITGSPKAKDTHITVPVTTVAVVHNQPKSWFERPWTEQPRVHVTPHHALVTGPNEGVILGENLEGRRSVDEEVEEDLEEEGKEEEEAQEETQEEMQEKQEQTPPPTAEEAASGRKTQKEKARKGDDTATEPFEAQFRNERN